MLLYTIILQLYTFGIRVTSLWNPKAKLWLEGRKNFPVFPLKNDASQQHIWIHCASLGEFEQGRPVIEKIKTDYPSAKIFISFFSPSGYEIQKNYTGATTIFYLPMDDKKNAEKMLSSINPTLILWVKYEYWFFYLKAFKAKNIPVLLVSGIFREGQPFFKWYGGLWKKVLPCFTHFFVQDEVSKTLLAGMGMGKNVTVSGDTRFDRVIEIAKKFEHIPVIQQFCGDNKVIVAGSTWEEDEAELIHYVRANPDIKFIIAPHEIDAENLRAVQKEFTGSILFSELMLNPATYANVLIIDNVGMLSRLYYYADITYIGGGFGDDGVHNVLEAAVYSKPVIYGPEFEKFIEAIELFNCGGGITINNALELEKELTLLWNDVQLLKTTGESAGKYVYANAGASKKIIGYIQENRLLTK